MSSLNRKIRRSLEKRGKKTERKERFLDEVNSQHFKLAAGSRVFTRIRQTHATKGDRVMAKQRLSVAQMSPADRWNKIIAPGIAKAMIHAKRIGYHA